ncbi:MAG: helix-turn-helix domain-containing protein [Bacteroidales bacterium]|nr:helix-turn-helix domain-containing protein [Bacteroidales bacterium]
MDRCVNNYRVEEVKRLMAEGKHEHYTLLAIALEAGFNSKSSFNRIFKEFTGSTPSHYKKTL